jgi:hypothetical protein
MVVELGLLSNVRKIKFNPARYAMIHQDKDGNFLEQPTGRIAHPERRILEWDVRRKDITAVLGKYPTYLQAFYKGF